jgi:hypothetical protein
VPPVPGTSSLRAPRWRRRAPVVARSREATRQALSDVTPNSCCDRNGGPTPPAHNRSAAPVPPAASLLPEPFRDRHNASSDPEAEPPLRSVTMPPLPLCPAPVASEQRSVDIRR